MVGRNDEVEKRRAGLKRGQKKVFKKDRQRLCQLSGKAGAAPCILKSLLNCKTPEGLIVKFLIDNWMLIAIALASGGMLLWPLVSSGMAAGSLSANGAVQLINREKAVVIDVCETEEFAAGHVAGAKNLPLGQFEEKLPGTVKNKALPLILVCASGARANRALAIAKKLGYEQAQTLSGGLKSWKEANLPIEKA
jgi:rhodanese-related sulfurtransferase